MAYKMYHNVIIPSSSKYLTWNSKIKKEGGGKTEQSRTLENKVVGKGGNRNSCLM